MTIIDIYAKRMKRLKGDVPDVYSYDKLPQQLRIQINYILDDALGSAADYADQHNGARALYDFIVSALKREFGTHQLIGTGSNNRSELQTFILDEANIDNVLSAIELAFKGIDKFTRDEGYKRYILTPSQASKLADDAINELNHRFREHGIGYVFENGRIVRVDSELLHDSAVKPALSILSSKGYEGPREEFLSAYDHYRHGNNKEAINDALKAFESTMKVICHKRNWPHDKKATSKTLIDVCFANGLVPDYLQHWFTALRTTLESGVPTSRNRASGHGQGVSETKVPSYLVAYVLHLTASAIVMLSEADKALDK